MIISVMLHLNFTMPNDHFSDSRISGNEYKVLEKLRQLQNCVWAFNSGLRVNSAQLNSQNYKQCAALRMLINFLLQCLWENRKTKYIYILSLRLELVEVDSYDFPNPCDGHPKQSPLFYVALSRH
jgi:hypothetical protein